ncbi:MAG: cyclic nucleotide-binding domain-containing protein [Acidimicrobiales bacterium]|nr:cyclic nucleotide-binding domain-containing protein [Acidimicrobiales bacterium]
MLATLGRTRSLADGEPLFHAGEPSGHVFVIDAGTVDIFHPLESEELRIGQAGVGEVLGEVTAVVGGARTATVRANGAVTVREIDNRDFDHWLQAAPDAAIRLAAEARERIDRTRVVQVLADHLGVANAEIITAITEQINWHHLDAGEILFTQGDPADAAYIVVAGRLHISATEPTPIDVEIGRGEIVGELGILEDQPRSATVKASRRTTLAALSRPSFEEITTEHPTLMLQVFRRIVSRVLRPPPPRPVAGSVAVAVITPDADPDFVARLSAEVARHGDTLHLDRKRVDTFLGRRGIADADAASAGQVRVAEFLHEADVIHRYVVLETSRPTDDTGLAAWTNHAVQAADRIVIVTSPHPTGAERRHLEELVAACEARLADDVWLACIHPADTRRPTATGGFRRPAADPPIGRVVHLRAGSHRHETRLARLMTGNGVGVAFSGGGGRAVAEVGAVQAMEELGVPIDRVVGTSMGSIVAGALAMDDDVDQLVAFAMTKLQGIKLVDVTVPVVSILKGSLLADGLERSFGEQRIEDLWLDYSCISADITVSQTHEHRSGRLRDAVRASISLPGVFPPVAHDGHFLVDGGVLENLPISPLVADSGVETIIAIEASPPNGPRPRTPASATAVSGVRALRAQYGKDKKSPYPGVVATLMGSMLVGSSQARAAALATDDVALHLTLELPGLSLLDTDHVPEMIEHGYADAIDQLRAWLTSDAAGALQNS